MIFIHSSKAYASAKAACYVALLILAGAKSPSSAEGKFVVFLVSSASYSELAKPELGNFSRILDEGSSGLMSVRAGRISPSLSDTTPAASQNSQKLNPSQPEESGLLTIGAGTQAIATTAGRLAFQVDKNCGPEKAADIFHRQTLISIGSSRIVHLGFQEIIALNDRADRKGQPGKLGETLKKFNIETAALGNSDGFEEPYRGATLICVDKNGLVRYGDVSGKLFAKSPESPYGIASDPAKFAEELKKLPHEVRLIVIDGGDLPRAERYAYLCAEPQRLIIRLEALKKTDALLGEILKLLDPKKDRLVVLSPYAASKSEDEPSALSPVVFWGAGIPNGIVTSASTRRQGIISNLDIAPSAIEFLIGNSGLLAGFDGKPAGFIKMKSPVSFILEQDQKLLNQMRGIPFARAAAVAQIGLIALSVVALLAWKKPEMARALALSPMGVILALFLSGAAISWEYVWIFSAVLIAVGSVYACEKLGKSALQPPLIMMTAVIISVVADLVFGGRLMGSSVIGYSAAMGSRYYGLGNEMMGLLTGCWTAATLILLKNTNTRLRGVLAAASGMALVLVNGLPFLGSNFGGALTAVAASVSAAWFANGRKGKKILFWLSAAGTATFFAAVAVNFFGGDPTHIGRALQVTAGRGLDFAYEIVARKIQMNIMLFQSSVWSKLLVTYLAAAALLISLPASGLLQALRNDRLLLASVSSISAAALAALVFNDSGVLAAATCLAPGWAILVRGTCRIESAD